MRLDGAELKKIVTGKPIGRPDIGGPFTNPMNSPTLFAMLLVCAGLFLAPVTAQPVISSISPPPGTQVATLATIEITFSEEVAGVDATDLLINGSAAQEVFGSGAGPYTFTFNQPWPGVVTIEMVGDTGIAAVSESGIFTAPPSWDYTLADSLPPTVLQRSPAAGSTAGVLTEAEVMFSEPVIGVDAADLRVNEIPAVSVTGFGAGPYRFVFPQPAAGTVDFSWDPAHAIMDSAENPFSGANWSVNRSDSGAGTLEISEFTAIKTAALVDEDGNKNGWIEIHNAGITSVNLGGWSLTDKLDFPRKWVFPNRTLGAGGYLVVFASGEDRRPASGQLHTNFKLGGIGGGDLALFSPDQPAVAAASEFAGYPSQRAGYSYGPAGYYTPPTPGTSNSEIVLSEMAAEPEFATARGFFEAPISLELTSVTPGATIRYTTNGSEPTETEGTVYSGPVEIAATTVVRAASFAAGLVPSGTITHTFIFQAQVINQPAAPAGFPTNWGPHNSFPGKVVPADYEMDSDPLRIAPTNSASPLDPAKVQRYEDGLRELPALALSMPDSSLFQSTGMYHSKNVTNKSFPDHGCSVELILADGTTAFATTSGLRMHGNASRDPLKNPKHGFKLKFKPEFGPSSLDYQLFPETAVKKYDDIVIRAEFGTSWRHWSDSPGNFNGGYQRSRSTAIRDQWMKDTSLEMGNLASHSRLVHLYLNGLYFGVYDLTEDPTSSFGQNFLGGQKTDYDVYDQGVLAEGTADIYNAMMALPEANTNSTYELYKRYIDMPEFIDYLLVHFYVGHQDWGVSKNWSSIRQRAGGTFTTEGKFRYIPWDLENILLNVDVNRVEGISGSDTPSYLHPRLNNNPQYRLDFADHIHKRMISPGGALTQARNTARWQKWQAILDKPIVAESMRWGDYRRDVHRYSDGAFALYTRESHWLAENHRIVNTYFPQRPGILMGQFRAAGLYPTLNAPELRIGGVAVGSSVLAPGSEVNMVQPIPPAGTTSAGTIFYTTDGTDPRVLYSGAVGTSAVTFDGTPLVISAATTIKARVRNGTTWSALNEVVFRTSDALPRIVISELMYNPPNGSTYEFIELLNTEPRAIDMSGWYFKGVGCVFPPGTKIAAGGRIVVASNDDPTAWRAKYPGVTPVAYFSGNLSNGGEKITLFDAEGTVVCLVSYKDELPWPLEADGDGYSLELVDPFGDPNDAGNWQASTVLDGSPGTINSPPPAPMLVEGPQDQIVPQGDPVSLHADLRPMDCRDHPNWRGRCAGR